MAKVGLCEDDPAIRRVVNDAMRLAGHDVVLAHNGAEALRLFAADDDLDVIILDIGLPDADGRDVCQALRSAGSRRRCCSSPHWARSTTGWPGSVPAPTTTCPSRST